MLKQRILTAIVLILLIIGSVFASSEIFAGVTGVFVIIAAWEWGRMTNDESEVRDQKSVFLLPFFIALVLLISYWMIRWSPKSIFFILSGACLWWSVALYLIISYQRGINLLPTSSFVKAGLGILILMPAWSALFLLHSYYGKQFVIFLLVLIWAADTGAYFSGKRWGRTKLAKKISPAKTLEGVAGGMALSLFVSISYSIITAMPFNTLLFFAFLSLITVGASILGDLVESLFKRQVGVKDSSQILPGHGGVLDRIDSLTAAAPIFTLGMILLDNRL